MSSMLEQAIIDATALKEAALKSAEEQIIEKYSSEVKEAVSAMLEEEDLVEAEEELALEEDAIEEQEAVSVEEIPAAAASGEKMCPCPEEEEIIKIDLDAFVDKAEDLADQDIEQGSEEALAADIAADEEEGEEEELALEGLEVDEELEIDDEHLNSILEKLVIDMEVTPRGKPAAESTEQEKALAKDIMKAREVQNQVEEDENPDALEEALAKNRELIKKYNAAVSKNEQIVSENKKLKDAVLKTTAIVESTNLNVAKLTYQNKVLGSDSLNERQKEQIAEAIGKTNSVDEAKVIYETLQGAVGSQKKKAPKSLSEAVNKGTMSVIRREDSNKVQNEALILRNKKLAGIL